MDLLKTAATLIVIICHYEDAFDIQNKVLIAGNGKTLFVYVIELFFIISGFLAFSGVRKINDGLSFNRYFSGKAFYRKMLELSAKKAAHAFRQKKPMRPVHNLIVLFFRHFCSYQSIKLEIIWLLS